MRLVNTIQLSRMLETPDGYGGVTEEEKISLEVPAIVTVKGNDLRVKPSGLGYYRSITLVVDKDTEVLVGDKVEYAGALYTITSEIDYYKPFHKFYLGYEV